jgi:hypothetical protein
VCRGSGRALRPADALKFAWAWANLKRPGGDAVAARVVIALRPTDDSDSDSDGAVPVISDGCDCYSL